MLPKKKNTLVVIIFFLAFVLTSFFLNWPGGRAAHAAGPTLTIYPSSGAYSAWNKISATGANYKPLETVNVYWNFKGPGSGTLVATATTSSAGAFNVSFNRPLFPTGTYTIAGVGQTSHFVATGVFLLLPSIYGAPLDSGPGTKIHITGNAFGNGETVKIYWNYKGPGTGTFITSATGNATGTFSLYNYVPANAPPGFTILAGVGQTSKAVAMNTVYVYPPTLALAPISGAAGTTLTMSAYGFTAGENVSLYWDNSSTPLSTTRTNGYGYLPLITFTVPIGTAPGSYPVKAVGVTSHITITKTFAVVFHTSTLQSTSGPVGATVNLSGHGYAPNEQVKVIWNYTGPGAGTTAATVVAGLSGVFSASFTVPAATTGAYTVAAVGATSNSVSRNTFTIINGLASSVSSASPGASVTVAGSGYQALEPVQLYWDSVTGISLGTALADAFGNISRSVVLPASASPGAHMIIGVGQISLLSFSTGETINTNWSDFGFDGNHDHQNTAEHTLSATNVAQLKLQWTATTSTKVLNSGCGAATNDSSPLYANGSMYFATADGYLNAYNAKTGALEWQFNTGSDFPNCSSPLYDPATGLLFFGEVGYNGAGAPSPFYALDAQTGKPAWSLLLPWDQYSFPTAENKTLFIGMSDEGHNESLYAIDEITGQIKWTQPATGSIWGEVVVDPAANMLFNTVGNPGPEVNARNLTTGALIWEFTPVSYGNDDDAGSPLTLGNGVVYENDKNGIVYSLNEKTGAVTWSTAVGAHSNGDVSAPALSSNGLLYVSTLDSTFYALNASSGAIVWKYTTGGPVYSSPALANGVVYFSSLDHYFYALNASTGALLWNYRSGAQAIISPIVVNGWLYCGSSDGKLYAFTL